MRDEWLQSNSVKLDKSWDMCPLTHLRMSTDRHRNPVYLVTDRDCMSHDRRDYVGKRDDHRWAWVVNIEV